MSKEIYHDKAMAWVSKKSSAVIRANLEGYDPPKVFKNKDTGEEIQADFSFESSGGSKSYTEIALKSDSPQSLVTRWKLLSLMASMKQGKLHLLAPKGHKMFTQKLVDQYNINAIVHSL
ncbi:MAG: hypothetical protein KJP00_10130 [Bacteroidia bacterium]|nr:hypothetical protein [Bacteroidia bacterium]